MPKIEEIIRGQLGLIANQVFGAAVDEVHITDPRLARAVDWLNRMRAHAFGSWNAVAEAGFICDIGFRAPDGTVHPCSDNSIGCCVGCSSQVCFSHAFMDGETGALICKSCVGGVERAGAAHPPPPRGWQPDADDTQERNKLRKKYFRLLRLRGEPTAAAINAAWRGLVAECHPDRASGEADRKRRHNRTVKINQARDWLLDDLEQRKAA